MDENLSRGYCQLSEDNEDRTSIPNGHITTPRDKHNLVYLSLVLAGAGFLLPYNSFITAVDYYHGHFPDSTIIFDISITYICMAFISVCINNLLVETFSLQIRITFGYILSFVTLLFVATCLIGLELFPKEITHTVTLVSVGVVALGCTVQQSSFYGYTGMLPRRYTQAVMTGESAAGLLVSMNRIATKALLNNERINTLIFFALSIAIVLSCFVIFHVTKRSEFVRFHVTMCKNAGVADDQRGITTEVSNPEEVDIVNPNANRDNYGVLAFNNQVESPDSATHEVIADPDAQGQESDVQIKRGSGQTYRRQLPCCIGLKRGIMNRYKVSKQVWPYMVAICLAYFVTLSLFPGIESEVVSCHLGSWMPVILISVFNLFDFIGKIIAALPYDWPRGRLVLCSLCRVALIPLMMLCATPRNSPVLEAEFWPIFLSLLLGLSNGYFGSVPMILASTKVSDEQKELSGNIMTLSYSVGLTGGSAVAYLLEAWVGPYLTEDPCTIRNITIIQHPYNATMFIEALTKLSETRTG
ncbi:unnamed protein product [Owenia fusiformis]|uniref:Uncharacterized protein n=1 Tax=Owenia fusiformis TaxID=6347 RepID=A0A8J1TUX6_OWEFU|nr:unnamed protein product [Owenia fusiformis]